MMRFCVRVAFGLIVTLSISSMAAAQVMPGTSTSGRDPLLKREFSRVSFGRQEPMPRPFVHWPEMRFRAIETLGAPLPNVTAAPQPHGTAIPCTMRVVRVTPGFNSNMPVVSVEERVDPKSVIKVVCLPRE
jgi:hypothetical protein